MDSLYKDLTHWASRIVEIAGVVAIVLGILLATIQYFRRHDDGAYRQYRSSIGRSILLGLEFLVAADIINTVTLEVSLRSLALLAGIILIRTFLSFTIELEIEGHWPWNRPQAGG